MRQYKEAVNIFRVIREYLISVISFGGKKMHCFMLVGINVCLSGR